MPYFFSRRKTITHHFDVDNDESNTWIGYKMIIVQYIMVNIGMIA